MPIRSAERRLKRLWRRQRELDAKINEALRRRLRQFRRGSISSEEFEKCTREERKFDRLRELIMEIEEKTKPRRQDAESTLQRRVYYSVVQPAWNPLSSASLFGCDDT